MRVEISIDTAGRVLSAGPSPAVGRSRLGLGGAFGMGG